MKTLKDLKQMMREPASKEWFAKHGMPKNHFKKAIDSASGKVPKKAVRFLSKAESKAKTKDWPSTGRKVTEQDKRDHQKKHGRSYDD